MAKERYIRPKQRMFPRFILEPYGGLHTRHTCPQCGRKHSFVRFIDVETGQYVGDDIGRCNREIKCGYFKPPTKENLNGGMYVPLKNVKRKYQNLETDTVSTIPSDVFLKSLSFGGNTFSEHLVDIFGYDKVFPVLQKYYVGTNNDVWEKATVFWQVDYEFNIRAGKIMLYDDNLKRVKNPTNHITWVHTLLLRVLGDYSLKQVFFGEHLINSYKGDAIHIVESEKTAIIMSIVKPQYLWLATGGLQNINEYRLSRIGDFRMVFHPDKGLAFDRWKEKLDKFKEVFKFELSDFLQRKDDVEEGEDLADYVISKRLKNR